MYSKEDLSLFTKNSSVLKHARFALQPVGETRDWIRRHDILSHDRQLQKDASEVMAICDTRYAAILRDFLAQTTLTQWSAPYIASEFSNYITHTLKLKEQDLFQVTFLKGLESQAMERLESLSDVAFLFQHYFVTRKLNLLSSKQGSFAHRVEENYDIACRNCDLYLRFRELYPAEAASFEAKHPETELLFHLSLYGKVLLPEGIRTYNQLISGDYQDGRCIKMGINQYMENQAFAKFGYHRQIPLLRKLNQPVLSTKFPDMSSTASRAGVFGGPSDAPAEFPLCFGRPKFLSRPWKLKHAGVFGNCDHGILQKDGIYYYTISRPSELFGRCTVKLYVYNTPPAADFYILMDACKETDACRAVPYLTLCSKTVREYFKQNSEQAQGIFLRGGFRSPVYVSRELYEGYQSGRYQEDKGFLRQLIGFFQEAVLALKSWRVYPLEQILKEPEDYKNLREFYGDIDKVTYRVNHKYINASVLEQSVALGETYLFRIDSEDLYKDSCRDVFGSYLRYFMSEENLSLSDLMLNGSPRISYRPPLIEEKVTHPIGSTLVNKRFVFPNEDGSFRYEEIPGEVYQHYYDYFNFHGTLTEHELQMLPFVKTRISHRDLVKDAHYAREQFSITLSFTINPEVSVPMLGSVLNEGVKNLMKDRDFRILKITRGREHLLAYTLLGRNGEILESDDLDSVNGIPYRSKLEQAQSETWRSVQTKGSGSAAATASYKRIGRIGGLHNAYLGDCVSYLISKALSENAVILLEGQGSFRSASASLLGPKLYQKFESVLFARLACYVDKNLPPHAPGGMLNPLQLVTTDNNNYHQNGIVFAGEDQICLLV